MRSLLYVPADNDAMLAKAASRGADALILDLEDGVAPSRKRLALDAALDFARNAKAAGPALWVRVNDGERGLSDIAAVAEASPANAIAGVWLPKAEPGAWLQTALAALSASGLRVGLLIESAAGIARVSQFPDLPRDSLVQIGEADLTASLRIEGRDDQLLVLRTIVVAEWAARGLAAPLAPVSVSVGDVAAFTEECIRLKGWGFEGRACVHPMQVAAVNEVWGTSASDLARAHMIVNEFEANEAEGVGAYRGSDGTMVDRATVRWAKSLIEGSS